MTGTGITAAVAVNGTALAVGSPAYDPAAPTVVSGLTIDWGRDTTLDQPGPATCRLSVLDVPGGTFADGVHVGQSLTVTASGTLYPDPSVSTITDPGFETGAAYWTPDQGTAALSLAHPHAGSRSLRFAPVAAGRPNHPSITVWPAAPSSDPAGWDAIPRTASGQTWTVGASVWAPAGMSAVVKTAYWSSPARGPAVVSGGGPVVVGNGGWQTVQASITPPPGYWVGVRVEVYPLGWTWQTVPAGTKWSTFPAGQSWRDTAGVYVDDVKVLAPAAGVPRTVTVFSGRITDSTTSWDADGKRPIVDLVAVDFAGDLANVDVSASPPWPAEGAAARLSRILTASGLSVTSVVDDSVSTIPVSWTADVAQPAAQLVADLATSVDAVAWPVYRSGVGSYVRLEDSGAREPLYRLELVGNVVVVVLAGGRQLSACDVLRDPVQWVTSVSDVATRATVTWLDQTVGTDGLPTLAARPVVVVATAMESTHGVRRVSIASTLTTDTDATNVATRVLARTSSDDWRALGITVDDAVLDGRPDQTDLLLQLLDAANRIGLPLRLADWPAWAPTAQVPVYVEGGTLTHDAGHWVVEATTSRAAGQGTSARWSDLPSSWHWNMIDPAISWLTMSGTAGPAT